MLNYFSTTSKCTEQTYDILAHDDYSRSAHIQVLFHRAEVYNSNIIPGMRRRQNPHESRATALSY